jgi:hypothetical protein
MLFMTFLFNIKDLVLKHCIKDCRNNLVTLIDKESMYSGQCKNKCKCSVQSLSLTSALKRNGSVVAMFLYSTIAGVKLI